MLCLFIVDMNLIISSLIELAISQRIPVIPVPHGEDSENDACKHI